MIRNDGVVLEALLVVCQCQRQFSARHEQSSTVDCSCVQDNALPMSMRPENW